MREYDAVVGRWTTRDPARQHYSPYKSFGNNPLSKIDIDGGVDDFIFDENGNYLRTENIGDPIHRIIIQNSKTGLTDQVFYFNDSKNDYGAMNYLIGKYGSATPFLFLKSPTDIDGYIYRAGVTSVGLVPDYLFIYEQSLHGGSLDFSVTQLLLEVVGAGISKSDVYDERGGFFVPSAGGRAYNLMDFGNYLWGRSLAAQGVGLTTATTGAQVHHILYHRRLGQGGTFDSKTDQIAIINGWSSFKKP